VVRTARAYLALGSNLGDREALVEKALEALRATDGVTRVGAASFVESDPVGGPAGQGRYLNGVVELETRLSPRELLRACGRIEDSLGRTRLERWGPRTMDIDILLYGDEVVSEPGLEIPHPRMCERWFVLLPLSRVAPSVRHPVTGLTACEMLSALGDRRAAAPAAGA